MTRSRNPQHVHFPFVVARIGDEGHPLSGPPVDVVDDGNRWRLVFEVPGASLERLSLRILGRVVVLSGERKTTEGERGQFLRVERVSGRFERALELPEDPDPDRTSATCSDGLLTVEIGKLGRGESRPIPITSRSSDNG
jgi:HSP20 family protein